MRPGAPGARGMEVFLRCWEDGVVVRSTGDTIAIAPIFDTTDAELERIVTTVRNALRALA